MAGLGRLEALSGQGHIDLFYGDESGVSLTPCVPYGWQFPDEVVSMPSLSGKGTNCFALLSRDNRCWFRTTHQNVSGSMMAQWLTDFAKRLRRLTVVVLDNATVHRGKEFRRYLGYWESLGLYIFCNCSGLARVPVLKYTSTLP